MSMNIPFQKREVEEYERKRYRGVDQRLVDWKEKKILRKVLQIIGSASLTVLDVPCGYGRFSGDLLDRGFFLVSSDLSFHMVKRVRGKSVCPSGLSGIVADAKIGLPFKQGMFHLLLSMRFFHHVHKKEERVFILNEFFRVTSEWVILSYYQKNFFHFLQRKFRKKIKKSRTQIKMISRSEFQKEVEQTGFHISKIFPLFRGIHAHQIALLKRS